MDYFEYGLPIINNIHGDTWSVIEREDLGINITSYVDYAEALSNVLNLRQKTRLYFENNLGMPHQYKNPLQ